MFSLADSPAVPSAGRYRRFRHLRRALGAAVIATTLAFVTAAPAFAHVTVNGDEVTAGSWTKITFRVPVESDTASTTALQISLPTDTPIPSISAQQVPGWSVQVSKVTLDPPVEQGQFILDEAVNEITWTADDGIGLLPGHFGEFALSIGPVPDVESLTFPAAQTYSDGEVVMWEETGSDAAYPAPVLAIHSAAAVDDPTDHISSDNSSVAAAQTLGAIGLALGAVAVVLALVALRRANKTRLEANNS